MLTGTLSRVDMDATALRAPDGHTGPQPELTNRLSGSLPSLPTRRQPQTVVEPSGPYRGATPQDEITRLRIENRVLTDELSEYRRRDMQPDPISQDVLAWWAVFDGLNARSPGMRLACAKLLVALIDKQGALLRWQEAIDIVKASEDYEPTKRLVLVIGHYLRKFLVQLGIADDISNPVETIRGLGYRMSKADAKRLSAWLGERGV